MRWIGLVVLGGCGGDGGVKESTVEDVCDQSCTRFEDCGVFGGYFTREQCMEQCTSQLGSDDDPDCQVSDREARACADAWDDLSCEEIEDGVSPEECDVCGTMTTPTTPTGTDDVTCDDLQDCCDAIEDANTAKACDNAVAQGNDALCATTLQGFVAAGFCPAS